MDDDFYKLQQIVGERVIDPQGHVIGKVAAGYHKKHAPR